MTTLAAVGYCNIILADRNTIVDSETIAVGKRFNGFRQQCKKEQILIVYIRVSCPVHTIRIVR